MEDTPADVYTTLDNLILYLVPWIFDSEDETCSIRFSSTKGCGMWKKFDRSKQIPSICGITGVNEDFQHWSVQLVKYPSSAEIEELVTRVDGAWFLANWDAFNFGFSSSARLKTSWTPSKTIRLLKYQLLQIYSIVTPTYNAQTLASCRCIPGISFHEGEKLGAVWT